jgi:hypothetical protein
MQQRLAKATRLKGIYIFFHNATFFFVKAPADIYSMDNCQEVKLLNISEAFMA